MDESSHRSKFILTTQSIIFASLTWAILALLYFLLFSAKIATEVNAPETRQAWYVIGTDIFEAVAFLSAGILCLRNWLNPQIISSRNVWLSIGLGMLAYFCGGLVFDYTEIFLQEDPDISLGDVFFVLTYLLLITGMVLAVVPRRINLEKRQWLVILAIGIVGSGLSWWISHKEAVDDAAQNVAPQPLLSVVLNWFYIVSDVLLLIIATAVLLAFWGGRVARSWQMIAAAAFSLYIADMWFGYAQGQDYQSGDLLEVFWVFSGILFGIGAVLEYDASLKRRQSISGRKRN